MKHCFYKKQRIFFFSASFFFLTVFFTSTAYAQKVDCSVSTNCSNAYCQFAANVERGCNCFDGLDNDGDGKVDKADTNCAAYYGLSFVGEDAECNLTPPGADTPFDLVNAPITSAQNTADTQSKISVGDVDGDGIPDAVITSKWNSEMRVVATRAPQPDGTKAGDVKSSFNLSGGTANSMFSEAPKSGACKPDRLLFEHENLIADIDGDGKAELFGVVSNRSGNPSSPPTCFYLVGFEYASGSLVPLFKAVAIGTDRPGTFGIADMDGDGKAEIYLRDRIYAAENGKLLASANGAWDIDVTSAPTAANISGDDKLELICGTKIYSIPSLTNRTPAAPAGLTLVHDMNTIGPDKCYVKIMLDPIEYGNDTHSSCSIADIDKDGNIDVVISGALNATNGKTAIFYWNVSKGKVSYYTPPDPVYANGWVWGTGRVNLIDTDKDGLLDMFFIAGSQLFRIETIGDQFHADINNTAVNSAWVTKKTINDSRSGVLTVTVYDFNNDGEFELVYRDSQELAVVDAATMTTKLWSAVCQSHTYTEGPIIADVNGDGGTDICVPCNTSNKFDINDPIQQQALGQFRLYYSAGNEWLPTRKVWNQPGYFVVNINDDLTLPFPQFDQDLVFSDGPCANGLPGPQMPLNVFLNQVPRLSASGCPIFPAPDLSFHGDNPDNPGVDVNGDGVYTPAVEVIPPICGDLAIQARFNIINDGDLPITADVPVSFFVGDPTQPDITSDSLIYTTTITVNDLQVDQTYTSPFVTFNGTGSAFRLYIVLNNDGSVLPVPASGEGTNECRLENNIYSVFVDPTPFTTKIEKIQDNFKCADTAPDNGEVRLRIFKGSTEVTDYSEYGFQWYTGPATSPVIITGATNYNLTGLAEGDYTAIVTNVVKGCTGIPVDTTIERLGVDPQLTLHLVSDQTKCNPPNGELLAEIAGGNEGYTFKWFENGKELNFSGNIANNLVGGLNYQVVVSKDGCEKDASTRVGDPNKPEAQAFTMQNVVDCLNDKSGSVTASALSNGIVQDPANYTFDWYYFNDATGVPGSILPAEHGTGPTRTGLPAGTYSVVVTEIATQCVPTLSPVKTTILEDYTMPTVSITEIAPQTSCDPANPNGILTASAAATGLINPDDFTFEWFKGDNTLPGNKIPITSGPETLSGSKGETVNSVSGGGIYYTVKVTTPNNCSATNKHIITEDTSTPVLALTQTPNSICDPTLASSQYNGTLTATVTFKGVTVTLPDPNYAFTWYNGSQTTDPVITVTDNTLPTLSGLNGGSYTAVVERTDLFCASSPVTRQVENTIVLPAIQTDSIPSTNCVVVYNGNTIANGEIAITTVDGATPTADYTFLWRDNGSPTDVDGQTTTDIKNIQGAYTYTVEVTNRLSGCVNSKNIALPDNSVIPVVSLAVLQENGICDPALTSPAVQFNGKIGANFITPSGNAADYKYTWRRVEGNVLLGDTPPAQPGLGVNEYGGLNGGYNYTVVAENTLLGCTSGVAQTFLPNNLALPVIKTDSIPSTNCAVTYNGNPVANGQARVTTVDGTSTGSTTNYRYLWSDDGVTPTPVNSTTEIIQNIQGGFQYSVQVTNTLTGCRNTHSLPLPDNQTTPVISVTKIRDNVNCDPALGNTGELHAIVTYNGIQQNDPAVPTALPANYVISWSTAATGDVLAAQPAGSYSAYVVDETLGCTSGPDSEVILDAFVYPAITIPTPIDQTSCDISAPNGAIQATVSDGSGATFVHTWYSGVGTGGTQLSMLASQADGATSFLTNRASNDYTIFTRNETTGCEAIKSAFIPNNITYPSIAFTGTTPVTICSPTPNGDATPNVSGLSALPNYNYTVYYVETFTGNPYPTDPGVIKGGSPLSYTNAIFSQPPVYANLAPGYLTALVVDNNTRCESTPQTIQILDNTEDYTINIDSKPFAGFCGQNGGGIEVTVERGGAPCTTCTYEWYNATPVNTNINFFNNPPDMNGVPPETLVVGEDLGMPHAKPGVGGGTYTLIVVDSEAAHAGCGNYLIETVRFIGAPEFEVTKTDVTKCIPPFDGALEVEVTGPSTYTVQIFQGNGPSGTELTPGSGVQASPVNFGKTALATGQYYVQVTDQDPANSPCPLGSVHQLDQLAFSPLIALNQVIGNTSCDPTTNADGRVELTATPDSDQDLVLAPTDFRITNITPAPIGFTPPQDIPDDGTSSGLINGFGPGAYTLTVTDNNSGCAADAVANIPDQPVLPKIFTVDKLDDSYCAPASNGQIAVIEVGVGGPEAFNNYEFEWYAAPDVTVAANLIYTAVGGGATTGEVFDGTKSGWSFGSTPGAGNGSRQYYVRGRRITGSGVGCYTQLEQMVVLDVHKTPNLTLTPFANTSCIVSENEGVIRAVSDIENDPRDADVRNIGTYTYTWTPDPAGGNTSGVAGIARTASFDITELDANAGNPYTVTAINSINGCVVSSTAIVPDNKLPITLISYTKQNQLICDVDGNITVSEVTIDASKSANPAVYSFNTAADLIANFNFEWYNAADDNDDDPSTFDVTQPLENGGTPITDVVLSEDNPTVAQRYLSMGEGTYYVIARREPGASPGAGCATVPTRIEIIKDVNLPQITALKAFANTSCVSAVVEGRIELTVNTPSGVAAETGSTYSYAWVPANPDPVTNPYGTGNEPNTTSSLTIPPGYNSPPPAFPSVALKDDTYTITVTNDYSGCFITATATVPKQEYPVTLISYTKQDQLICDPDGNITVTQVTIDGSSSNLPVYTFNSQADLIANFDFSWYDANNDGDGDPATYDNTIRLTDGTLPITAAILSEDPAETSQPFPNMGAGTYHVLAMRKPGMVPGAGCRTQAVRVDIQDLHNDPRISFTSTPNSSCNLAFGNGVVTGAAFEQDNSVDNYNFSWTFEGNPLAAVPDGTTTQVNDAIHGAYTLTARNVATGCRITSNFDLILDQTRSTPNIIDVATVDPLDCLASGAAEVTRISIGGQQFYSSPPDDLDAQFDYLWYKTTYSPGSIIAGEENHNLLNIFPDKYYVIVQHLTTDCKSTPKEVVINSDDIVYPVVTITQSQLQISCPSSFGTGELMALADNQDDTNPNYSFTWYNNLTASGSPLNGTSTSTLSNLISGDYSVLATDATTGCSASEVYIIQNEADKYLPVLSLTPQPRLSCLVTDGALLVREVQAPNKYPIKDGAGNPAFNYTVEYYEGDGVDVSLPGINMPALSNRIWMVNTLDTLRYTIKITDNNTSCITTGLVKIPDGRKDPVVVIVEDNPMKNCDPARPNGQLSATADNGKVGGYTFQWYAGDAVAGSAIQQNNKLVGQPKNQYIVRVTNNVTGCYEDAKGEITDGTVIPPNPTALVVQDRTHCITPDGWVTANVAGTTFNYLFHWSDGTTAKVTPDFRGVNYINRDIGFYTVTAKDVITGCVSPPATVEVKDARVYPDIIFTTTPSFCEDIPDSQEGNGTAEIQFEPADIVSDEITWFDVSTQSDQQSPCLTCTVVGTGSYLTGMWPGFYQANVLTSKGCEAVETAEIKTDVRPYNLVTRNNDGKNDRFVVDCISRFKNNNVKIFNRSGVLVYEADGYNNDEIVFEGLGKQGIYTTGNELPVGTYFYIINKRDGTRPKTGYLELVK